MYITTLLENVMQTVNNKVIKQFTKFLHLTNDINTKMITGEINRLTGSNEGSYGWKRYHSKNTSSKRGGGKQKFLKQLWLEYVN